MTEKTKKTPNRETALVRRQAREASAAAARQDWLAKREQAVLRLRVQADSLQAAHEAVQDVILANLGAAGLEGIKPEVALTYSSYSPTGRGLGYLHVAVRADWTAFVGKTFFSVRDLVDGVGSFSYTSDGGALHSKSPDYRANFSIALEPDDARGQPLVLLAATVAQERALASALETFRKAQETSSVSQALSVGTGADSQVLQTAANLAQEVAELESQLEEKREALAQAEAKASVVRKRLREVETPGSKAIREQLNAVRKKLGLAPA